MKCLTSKYLMLLVASAWVVTDVSAQTRSKNILDYGAKPVKPLAMKKIDIPGKLKNKIRNNNK